MAELTYGVMVGADLFIGTTGILTVELDGRAKPFFRVREIDRARSPGSYITIDVDIRDPQGSREVKLHKNQPVAGADDISVIAEKGFTEVRRKDGSVIIRVEELPPDHPSLCQGNPTAQYLKQVFTVLRITGDFYAGPHRVIATEKGLQIGGVHLSGNVSVGTGGIRLSSTGFAM